jgi:molybdopterin-containing oxidoreductase family membrane subunit
MAPRFLASAFSAGPAFLVLVCLILRKTGRLDPGKDAIQALAKIGSDGRMANLFFLACEVFVVFYSGLPDHVQHFRYLYVGLEGHSLLVPWMWAALLLMSVSCVLLILPSTRKNETILAITCLALFIGTWIDKGVGLVTGGFVPTPLHRIQEYAPTVPEVLISMGIFGVGLLVLTILLKLVVEVRKETG